MARTQEFRQLAVATPLGEDVLLLKRLRGTEQLGRPFEYELDLLSENPNIPLADIIGQNVTVRLQRSPEGEPRHFNGYVSRFSLGRALDGTTEYRAAIVPWLWFLTRTSDCRIFQNKAVPEIIEDVFRGHGFTDFEQRARGTYTAREYCVQYNETDFDFVSRLMEQEGIFYYFRHENSKHTLVMASASSPHDTVAGYERIPYRPPTESLRAGEYIHEWTMERQVQPDAYSHTDFDFKNPSKQLLSVSKVAPQEATGDFEIFEYPGQFQVPAQGQGYARCRIEEYQIEHEVVSGTGDVRGITTGRRFVLADHPREDQCREYLVTGTTIEAASDPFGSGGGQGGGENYSIAFTGIEIHRPYRPPRITPRPMIRGPQTALVVGPKGEEIHTDKYGRVKVMFHWDRYAKADENSSCWIRVAQHWAGKKWGTIFTPRIGHEVIVEFLEGNPDRPIITGRVYNQETMPPYKLPTNMTMSTIKTLSSKGGKGFNEIRFEDKKGEEQVFIHGEKNQDVRIKNDCFEWIGNNRHLIVKKDRFEHVENNRSEVVDADHMEEIGKDRHVKVKGKEALEVTGSRSLKVTGDVIEKFMANHSEEVTQDLYFKAMGIVIEAMTGITLKVGGSNVVIDNMGVSVKGGVVTIDGGMTKINMGPGSPPVAGKAGSLVAPAAATKAEEADTADPGEMTEVKARQRQTKTGKYGAVQIKPFKPPKPEEAQALAPAAAPAAAARTEAKKEEAKKLSWIEIELVGEDDQPIPGERYRIKLPDGETVAEGTLDDKGWARVAGFDPGSCQVCFPGLDEEAWEFIESLGPREEAKI